MKKYNLLLIIFSLILFCGCSVQEKMNADLFLERLSYKSVDFDYESIDLNYNENDCVCFMKDKFSYDYVFDFCMNKHGDINKIGFACSKTDKAGDFIKYIGDIISVYSPEENPDDIIHALTENGKMKKSYNYYETQWYYWSSFSDENGLYFSVTNKKLSEPITAEYSLKPNDKTAY